MNTLSPSGLKQAEQTDTIAEIKSNENYNINRLNGNILGLSFNPGLGDTSGMTSPSNESAMIWDSGSSKYTLRYTTTTTTTTTTTV